MNCQDTPAPECSLSQLGVGSQPAQRTTIRVSAGDSRGLFQPAACSFSLARQGQGVLEFPAKVAHLPSKGLPGSCFSPFRAALPEKVPLSGVAWVAQGGYKQQMSKLVVSIPRKDGTLPAPAGEDGYQES